MLTRGLIPEGPAGLGDPADMPSTTWRVPTDCSPGRASCSTSRRPGCETSKTWYHSCFLGTRGVRREFGLYASGAGRGAG